MYSLIEIDPTEIDLSPKSPFRFRFTLPHEGDAAPEEGELIDSVGESGIIRPPILVRKADTTHILQTSLSTGAPRIKGGDPTVPEGAAPTSEMPCKDRSRSKRENAMGHEELFCVSGHRRISAALAAGVAEVEALVLKAPIEKRNLVDIWLKEVPVGKPPSEIERVILLEKLLRLTGPGLDRYSEQLSKIFERRITDGYASRLIEILDEDPMALRACHRGFLRADELLRFRVHPAIEQSRVAALLMRARVKGRERREIIHLLELLGGKAPETLRGFLDRAEKPDTSPRSISNELRRLVYPTLTSYEEDLRDLIERIGLASYAAITYPENLEGPALTLTVRFRKKEDLELVMEKLSGAISRGLVDEMFSILKGDSHGQQRESKPQDPR